MENDSNMHCTRAATPAANEIAAAATPPGKGLPPEVLGRCLADLKRQIALRQAMP